MIATFEESLITPGSAIDRFILGDSNALTIQQQRGLHLFKSYGCTTCHQGINIGGNIFQKFGRLQHVPLGLKTDLDVMLLPMTLMTIMFLKYLLCGMLLKQRPIFTMVKSQHWMKP
ncbi:hypothetical protein [Psychrosphaera algicola]|uniref:Cytochrome c domain-containing protein n=1 Tax=Psychrosphaera algicola TaxID=3023714 RepID=A0ABT5F8Y2_9GAMM|nr:hypothetical protein [Psychrosphaera sp. G1-22]MDC2887876.1 hypothetical protein [Psychrosphaera sp. G1-22]